MTLQATVPLTRWAVAGAGERLAALALSGLLIAVLGGIAVPSIAPDLVAAAALAAFAAVAWPSLPRRDHLLLVAGGGLLLAVVALSPEPLRTAARSLHLATLLGALMLVLGMLRDAARTSRAVRTCGASVMAQPPARRYLALTMAAHLFAVVLNFGIINLFGVMVMRTNTLAAAGGDAALQRARQRRMMLAILRGHNAMICWSPLSITLAVCLVMFPGLGWADIAGLTVIYAFAFLLLGCLVDRLEGRSPDSGSDPPSGQARLADALPMGGILGALLALILGVHFLAGLPMLEAVLASGTGFAALWLLAQYGRRPSLRRRLTLRRLARAPVRAFVGARSEVVIVAMAALIGSATVDLLPQDMVETLFRQLPLPATGIALLMGLLVVLAGQVGINALVAVSVLGAAAGNIVGGDLTATMCAMALIGGCTISTGTSPYGTPIAMTATLTGESPERIGRVWNLGFALAAFGLVAVFVWLASLLG